jgi:hypothetical protein
MVAIRDAISSTYAPVLSSNEVSPEESRGLGLRDPMSAWVRRVSVTVALVVFEQLVVCSQVVSLRHKSA